MKKYTKLFFLTLCFFLFIPNYYSNFWGIANENQNFPFLYAEGDISNIKEYDAYCSMLVISRLAESQRSGVFSHAGLPGMNFDKDQIPDSIVANMYQERERHFIWYKSIVPTYLAYFSDKAPAPDFSAYTSQVGAQMMIYGAVNNTLPFNNKVNFIFIKLLNAILVSLVFVYFLDWIYRNFGLITSIVTFILILISPWLILLGGSLWWSIWGLYIPFLAMLYTMERRSEKSDSISENTVLFIVFLAVSFKCLFTGMEFITSSLMAIYSPIVYCFFQEKKKIISLVVFSLKVGMTALCAVFVNLLILFFQLKSVMGGAKVALDYLVFAYVRRTEFVTYEEPDNIFVVVLEDYLKFDAFDWGIINKPFTISYFYVIGIAFVLSFLFYFIFKNKEGQRKYVSLSITTIFSFLAPLSWYYIFVQHAHQHPCYDNIVWYMPFMLYAYVIIGATLSLLLNKVKNLMGGVKSKAVEN